MASIGSFASILVSALRSYVLLGVRVNIDGCSSLFGATIMRPKKCLLLSLLLHGFSCFSVLRSALGHNFPRRLQNLPPFRLACQRFHATLLVPAHNGIDFHFWFDVVVSWCSGHNSHSAAGSNARNNYAQPKYSFHVAGIADIWKEETKLNLDKAWRHHRMTLVGWR